jgi:hypothetical protein
VFIRLKCKQNFLPDKKPVPPAQEIDGSRPGAQFDLLDIVAYILPPRLAYIMLQAYLYRFS